MTPPTEQRLRNLAAHLDQASDRYTQSRPSTRALARRSRRPALIGAAALTAAAAIIAIVAFHDRGSPPEHLQQAVNQTQTTQPAPPDTGITEAPTTTDTQTPTSTTLEPSQPVDHTRAPVRDRQGNQVGWIDETNQADMLTIALPADYTTRNPQGPATIGVIIVRDAKGNPVGLMTDLGYIAGGLTDGTHIDPAIQQQLIDKAINNSAVTTTNPTAATIPQG